jgi:hypothetical protein
MTYPTFNNGDTLPASDLNAIGLWLVKSQTVGAGVGSVAITNCFNSDFRNYRITFDGGNQAVNNNVFQFVFAGGTPHYGCIRYDPFNGVGAGTLNTFNQTFVYFGLSGTQNQASLSMDVLAPNLPEFTKFHGLFTGDNFAGSGGGVNASTTPVTGFSILFPAGGNTGGVVKVYGYRN